MPDFSKAKGHAADEAAAKAASSNFKPWAPIISWQDVDEEHYVLFLTPYDDTVRCKIQEFVPVSFNEKNGKPNYEFFLYRKDPVIGESSDLLEERNKWKPADRRIGVAVELEAELGGKGSRPRPVSFSVKTGEYEKKIFEDNEDTGKTETVEYPVIGLVSQAQSNFWEELRSYDLADGPIESVVFRVRRLTKGKDTSYSIKDYEDIPIDLSNLFENIENVSYLRDSIEELQKVVENGDEEESKTAIGETLLYTRLNELADKERYDELVEPLEDLVNPWAKDNDKPKSKAKARPKAQEVEETEEPEEKEATSKTSRKAAFDRIRQANAK